ncbi:MAG: SgcJ/EcaC family oxidoreductase [Alphaproteobacteria bacterium]|nr:SgcJ/EcaC family oxidoreductase [Alphaproteobacteria bacterium]MBO6861913.1 SgcJ/EcaC family oxidoreductase [Alphaproteobacteria bacterium]
MTQSSAAQIAADKAEIETLVADWRRAVEAKDADGLVRNYQDDTVLFDAISPFQTVGKEAVRKIWQTVFPYFPDRFKSEHKDLTVHVDGDLAVVFGLHHFVPEPADHPCGATWMRITVCLHRVDGDWRVLHEHVSVPFDPMTGQAALTKDL